MPNILKNIAGQRHGKLVALRYHHDQKRWECLCDCGNTKFLTGSHFRRQVSCGCRIREVLMERNLRHGDSPRGGVAVEYRIYNGMIRRCTNPNDAAFHYYGGRGIKVCTRWVAGDGGKSGYECFLTDMGRRPSDKHSIDRTDNDGDYEPSNCAWALRKQQMRNRRNRRTVLFRGRAFPLAEAAELVGLSKDVVWGRLNLGWSDELALTTPVLPPFGGTGAVRFSHNDAGRALRKLGGRQ